jgi:hypothetical protein
MEYYFDLKIPIILPIISQIRQRIPPKLRIFGVEIYIIRMSDARIIKIDEN